MSMVQIPNKVKRVERSLDAIECGRYSELTLQQCCDYIAWIARWKKVPREVWAPLCEKATKILEENRA